MDAGTVLKNIKTMLEAPAEDPIYEGLVAGREAQEIRAVAVCATPTVRVLREAAERGCNLVIADGHPFYTYTPDWGAANVRELVDNTALGQAKQALIENNQLAIIRLPTAFQRRFPTDAAMALAQALGLRDVTYSGDPAAKFVLASVSPTAIDELAMMFAEYYRCRGIRLMGHRELAVKRIAIGSGLLSPADIAEMLADPTVDLVVGGEVVEWEGAPYFEDVITSGRGAGLLLTGQAMSREPLARAMSARVQPTLPNLSVVTISDTDPVWSIARNS